MTTKAGKKKKKKFAISVGFSKTLIHMGANVNSWKLDVKSGNTECSPPLFLKQCKCEHLSVLFHKDTNLCDHRQKVMKTRGGRENIKVTDFESCSIEIH